MKCLLNVIAFLFLVSSSLLAAPACDRRCLAGHVTQCMDAMLAHKPERVEEKNRRRQGRDFLIHPRRRHCFVGNRMFLQPAAD